MVKKMGMFFVIIIAVLFLSIFYIRKYGQSLNKIQENVKEVPSWDEWINLTEEERWDIHFTWNVYAGDGEAIARKVLAKFKEEYRHIPKLKIGDWIGIYHGGTWAIHVEYPFIFDKRKIPSSYLGIDIRGGTQTVDMPKEFQVKDNKKEYVWAPERYEEFVDRCADEIRKELGEPNMSRYEMLSALCGRDFKEHSAQCKEWEKKGLIPSYTKTNILIER
jgi:hypothetical protein